MQIKRGCLKSDVLYFPQSHEDHKALITNVEKFFVYLAALWGTSFETTSLNLFYT